MVMDVGHWTNCVTGTYTKGTQFTIYGAQTSTSFIFDASDVSQIVIANGFDSGRCYKIKDGVATLVTASSTTSFGSGNDFVYFGLKSPSTGYTTWKITIS